MNFSLTILGCSSALPTAERFPTSQILNVNEAYYLIDCGEGTQIQLRRLRFKMQRIRAIFISHMHGDHYFGLPGLLNSLSMLGREKPLVIHAPATLKAILELQMDWKFLRYPLTFVPHPEDSLGTIYSDEHVEVSGIPLDHRMPTTGFLFREQPKERKIIKDKLKEEEVVPPLEAMASLKQGQDFTTEDGQVFHSKDWTTSPPAPRSFAFCSDTRYSESVLPHIRQADLLYHESTFLEDMKAEAAKKYHSTAKQAASIASQAEVGQLVLGHYSVRYLDLQPFLDEAQPIFPNTVLGEQGRTYKVALKKT